MQDKIKFLALDIVLSVLLGLSITTLVLPFVLYLGLQADNDSYIEIAKWGGASKWVLAHFDMRQMLRWEWFALSALCIIISFGLWYQRRYGFPTHMESNETTKQ